MLWWREPRISVPILFTKCEGLLSIRVQFYSMLYHTGNAWVFQSISQIRENPPKRILWGEPENWHPYFSESMCTSMVSYGTLHPEGNAQAFLRKSHSMGTCSKTHPVGRAWEIDSHTFRKVWVVLSHQISILWYTLSHGNCMSFTINVPLHEETQKNPSFKSVCSINFSFYGTLHQMNGTQIFPWNPHNIVKFSETLYHIGRTWNANSRTFFQDMSYFSSVKLLSHGILKKDDLHKFLRQRVSFSM